MIVDAHTHLGKPGHALNGRAAGLLKSMDENRIDQSLVFAGRLNGITTEEVLQEIKEVDPKGERLFAVASVSPDTRVVGRNGVIPSKDLDCVEELARLEDHFRSQRVVALKLYPGYEDFGPDESQFLAPYLEIAQASGCPVIIHTGDTVNKAKGARLRLAHPLLVDDLAVDFPELKIVIAHCGYPWQRDAAEVVYKNKNVWADCSGFVYGDARGRDFRHFAWMVEEFTRIAGFEKLMFGTDWPVSNQGPYLEMAKFMLDELWYPGELRSWFWGEAAKTLFDLPPSSVF